MNPMPNTPYDYYTAVRDSDRRRAENSLRLALKRRDTALLCLRRAVTVAEAAATRPVAGNLRDHPRRRHCLRAPAGACSMVRPVIARARRSFNTGAARARTWEPAR